MKKDPEERKLLQKKTAQRIRDYFDTPEWNKLLKQQREKNGRI